MTRNMLVVRVIICCYAPVQYAVTLRANTRRAAWLRRTPGIRTACDAGPFNNGERLSACYRFNCAAINHAAQCHLPFRNSSTGFTGIIRCRVLLQLSRIRFEMQQSIGFQ